MLNLSPEAVAPSIERLPSDVVAVAAFDQITPFHLAVPCAVFGDRHADMPAFTLKVCAIESGPIRTTAGFSLGVEHDLSDFATAGIIIVPSWRDPLEQPPTAMLDALLAAHARGARIVGLCLGAYVLAEAGLLDGRQATTHWAYTADFARRYPLVTVNADALYIEDGNVLTSAGTAAGIDCCLHMLRQRHGAACANALARRLVVPPHRDGGQAQFIPQPIPVTDRESRLSVLIDAWRGRLGEALTVDSVAAEALMSRRTFTRQFRQLTGTTFVAWLGAARLALVQHLLESGEQSIDRVATLAGFGSPESLRLHFRRAFGVSPSTWRQTFKG